MAERFDLNKFIEEKSAQEKQVVPGRRLVAAMERTPDGIDCGPTGIYNRIFVVKYAVRTAHRIAVAGIEARERYGENTEGLSELITNWEQEVTTARLELAWLRGDYELVNRILGK